MLQLRPAKRGIATRKIKHRLFWGLLQLRPAKRGIATRFSYSMFRRSLVLPFLLQLRPAKRGIATLRQEGLVDGPGDEGLLQLRPAKRGIATRYPLGITAQLHCQVAVNAC